MANTKTSEFYLSGFSEAAVIDNFRLTADSRLEQRGGTRLAIELDAPIRGAYSYGSGEEEVIFAVAGDRLYRIEEGSDGFVSTELGTLTGAVFADQSESVELFMFTGKLYILGGGSYYRYDGTTLSEVDGYVPLIARYAGAVNLGEDFERENYLTNRVRMRFSPDGSTKTFRMRGKVKSVESVTVGGTAISTYTNTTGYNAYIQTQSLYAANSNDIIEVVYTLDQSSRRQTLCSCRHAAVYGGDTDSRVFLFGGDERASIFTSELTDADSTRKISGEYFPVDAVITVGDGNLTVNGAVRQFDRLAIFTGDGAFYTYPREDGKVNGIEHYDFPILPLNSEVGATPAGGAVLVENEPYAMSETGLYRFKSTSVRDERLAVRVEPPARIGLTMSFMTQCRLYVNRTRGELWCYHNGIVIIYNARLDRWYRFTGLSSDFIFTYKSEAAFVDGARLIVSDETLTTDSGVDIAARYESDWIELNPPFELKTLYGCALELDAVAGAEFDLTLIDDHGCELTHRFTLDESSDAPAVIATHSRLGRFRHLRVVVSAVSGSSKLTLRRAKLIYR